MFCLHQGSLKGESVVAAILSSRMEQSYCTSGFFRFQARFLTSSPPILTITHYLRMCFTKRVTLHAPPVVASMSLSNDSNCVTTGSAATNDIGSNGYGNTIRWKIAGSNNIRNAEEIIRFTSYNQI